MAEFVKILNEFRQNYAKDTPSLLKVIDVYLLYIMLTGVAQFVYVVLVGTFPFNSFLSGFISAVASFILGVSLRLQVANNMGISKERAFFDFIVANLILHLVVMNFMG